MWLLPGLAAAETIFGFGHGIGWIVMVLLILAALRASVVSMRSAVAVAVLGGIGPFFGSYELRREQIAREQLADAGSRWGRSARHTATTGAIESERSPMATSTTVQVTLPAMGESVTEGTVLEWHKAEG